MVDIRIVRKKSSQIRRINSIKAFLNVFKNTVRHLWKFQRSNKETHPSSQYKFAVRSSLIFFWRIIRAPLSWSLRSLWRMVLSALDQTISHYSIKGWTKDVYKSLLVSVSKNFRILPNKFSLRVTLLEILLMFRNIIDVAILLIVE